MHMLSRKDLNSAELETFRVSRNPTTVITANGEVQTNEEATLYVYDLDLFVTVPNPRGYACSPIAWENSAKIKDILMSGPADENHILKWPITPMQHRTLFVDRRPHPDRPDLPARLRVHPQRRYRKDSMRDDSTPCPATTRSRSKRSLVPGDQLQDSKETKPKKKEDIDAARRSPFA